MTEADQNYMALALEVAERAAARGEVPVGAVIVQDGKLLVRAGNRVEADNDPTAHAEIFAIRAAADMLDAPSSLPHRSRAPVAGARRVRRGGEVRARPRRRVRPLRDLRRPRVPRRQYRRPGPVVSSHSCGIMCDSMCDPEACHSAKNYECKTGTARTGTRGPEPSSGCPIHDSASSTEAAFASSERPQRDSRHSSAVAMLGDRAACARYAVNATMFVASHTMS